MDSFSLVYGALDFVITPDGEWVFLEINPTGQYGFIEHATGAPLTAQLADLLTGGAA
jgi:D-alanine-D-alanine ligase-like ATP-grasp enzyme